MEIKHCAGKTAKNFLVGLLLLFRHCYSLCNNCTMMNDTWYLAFRSPYIFAWCFSRSVKSTHWRRTLWLMPSYKLVGENRPSTARRRRSVFSLPAWCAHPLSVSVSLDTFFSNLPNQRTESKIQRWVSCMLHIMKCQA